MTNNKDSKYGLSFLFYAKGYKFYELKMFNSKKDVNVLCFFNE